MDFVEAENSIGFHAPQESRAHSGRIKAAFDLALCKFTVKSVNLDAITAKSLPHILPGADMASRTANDYPRLWSNDLKEDLLVCKNIIEEQGMEMLVLDQTRAHIGLPVVKVIVPGLRHFWPRFAQGRLY